MDFNVEVDFDESEFKAAVADQIEEMFREHLETEVRRGHIECECGSDSFDIETWYDAADQLQGAAVCRECNERIELDIDTSDIDDLR